MALGKELQEFVSGFKAGGEFVDNSRRSRREDERLKSDTEYRDRTRTETERHNRENEARALGYDSYDQMQRDPARGAGGRGGGGDSEGSAAQPEGSVQERGRERMNFLVNELGYTPEGAAGVVGNALQESTFGHSLKPGGDGGTAFGEFQWRGDRWTNFQNYAKQNQLDPKDWKTAYRFMDHEAGTAAGGNIREQIRTAKDPVHAANLFALKFERPQGAETGNANNIHGIGNRRGHARNALGWLNVAQPPVGKVETAAVPPVNDNQQSGVIPEYNAPGRAMTMPDIPERQASYIDEDQTLYAAEGGVIPEDSFGNINGGSGLSGLAGAQGADKIDTSGFGSFGNLNAAAPQMTQQQAPAPTTFEAQVPAVTQQVVPTTAAPATGDIPITATTQPSVAVADQLSQDTINRANELNAVTLTPEQQAAQDKVNEEYTVNKGVYPEATDPNAVVAETAVEPVVPEPAVVTPTKKTTSKKSTPAKGKIDPKTGKPVAAAKPLTTSALKSGTQSWGPRYGKSPKVAGYDVAQLDKMPDAAMAGIAHGTTKFANMSPQTYQQIRDYARWRIGEDAYAKSAPVQARRPFRDDARETTRWAQGGMVRGYAKGGKVEDEFESEEDRRAYEERTRQLEEGDESEYGPPMPAGARTAADAAAFERTRPQGTTLSTEPPPRGAEGRTSAPPVPEEPTGRGEDPDEREAARERLSKRQDEYKKLPAKAKPEAPRYESEADRQSAESRDAELAGGVLPEEQGPPIPEGYQPPAGPPTGTTLPTTPPPAGDPTARTAQGPRGLGVIPEDEAAAAAAAGPGAAGPLGSGSAAGALWERYKAGMKPTEEANAVPGESVGQKWLAGAGRAYSGLTPGDSQNVPVPEGFVPPVPEGPPVPNVPSKEAPKPEGGPTTTASTDASAPVTGGGTEKADAKSAPTFASPELPKILSAGMKRLQQEVTTTDEPVPTEGGKRAKLMKFASNADAPSQKTMNEVFERIDPEGKLDNEQRMLKGMMDQYDFWMAEGRPDRAHSAVASMLAYSKKAASTFGSLAIAALKDNNPIGAAQILSRGYAVIPDGKSLEITPFNKDGSPNEKGEILSYRVVDRATGKVVDEGAATKENLGQLAMGMATGQGWMQQMFNATQTAAQSMSAGRGKGSTGPNATEQRQEARRLQVEAGEEARDALQEYKETGSEEAKARADDAIRRYKEYGGDNDTTSRGIRRFYQDTGVEVPDSLKPTERRAPTTERERADTANQQLLSDYKTKRSQTKEGSPERRALDYETAGKVFDKQKERTSRELENEDPDGAVASKADLNDAQKSTYSSIIQRMLRKNTASTADIVGFIDSIRRDGNYDFNEKGKVFVPGMGSDFFVDAGIFTDLKKLPRLKV